MFPSGVQYGLWTNTRRCKLVVCKQSYIKTELVVGLVGEGRGVGQGLEGSRSKRNGGRCPLGDSQQEDRGYCNCPFPMLYEPAHVISRCLAFWFLVYSQSALGVGDVVGQGWPIIVCFFALLNCHQC